MSDQSKEFYERVFDILIRCAGAPESMRENFIYCQTKGIGSCDEYRFQGRLGYGGKYWRKSNKVNCYSEDLTDDRAALIQDTNEKLKSININQTERKPVGRNALRASRHISNQKTHRSMETR